MSCVCCSHVRECGVGHVLFSSPNLDATNVYFSFFPSQNIHQKASVCPNIFLHIKQTVPCQHAVPS